MKTNRRFWRISCLAALLMIGAPAIAQEDGGQAGGIAMSDIIGNTRPPYDGFFQRQAFSVDPAFQAGNTQIDFGQTGLNLNLSNELPFLIGQQPNREDWMLRLGPLYADVSRAQFRTISSDNARFSETNRESGTIGMITADMRTEFQFGDHLNLRANGQFIALPFEGEAGFAGFGMQDSLSLGTFANGNGNFNFSAVSSGEVGNWRVHVVDRFDAQQLGLDGELSARLRGDLALLDRQAFDEVDEVGRYSFGGYGGGDGGETDFDSFSDRFSNTDRNELYTNLFSASAQKVVETQTMTTFDVTRQDRWNPKQRSDGEHHWSESAGVRLQSIRSSTRFKPFASYRISRSKDATRPRHVMRAGFDGPATDNTDLHADVGYTNAAQSSNLLWSFRIENRPRETTRQTLGFTRHVRHPENEIEEVLFYTLRQELGPYLVASLITRWSESVDEDDGTERERRTIGGQLNWDTGPYSELTLSSTYTEMYRNGSFYSEDWTNTARFSHSMGPRTDLTLSLFHSRAESANGDVQTQHQGTARLDYFISDYSTLDARYEYRRQMSETTAGDSDIYENVLRLTYTRRF